MKVSIETPSLMEILQELKESAQNKNSLRNIERKHNQELIELLKSRSVNTEVVTPNSLFAKPKNAYDVIKTFSNEHENYMDSIDEAIQDYSLTVGQAELVDTFKKEAMKQFHQCLTFTENALSKQEDSTNISGYINTLRLSRPETYIKYTSPYNSNVSITA